MPSNGRGPHDADAEASPRRPLDVLLDAILGTTAGAVQAISITWLTTQATTLGLRAEHVHAALEQWHDCGLVVVNIREGTLAIGPTSHRCDGYGRAIGRRDILLPLPSPPARRPGQP